MIFLTIKPRILAIYSNFLVVWTIDESSDGSELWICQCFNSSFDTFIPIHFVRMFNSQYPHSGPFWITWSQKFWGYYFHAKINILSVQSNSIIHKWLWGISFPLMDAFIWQIVVLFIPYPPNLPIPVLMSFPSLLPISLRPLAAPHENENDENHAVRNYKRAGAYPFPPFPSLVYGRSSLHPSQAHR